MSSSLARWILGAFIFLFLAWRGIERSYPLLPGPITLTLTLPAGVAREACAIVATGQAGVGDLLYLRYVDPTTIVFGYDSWAVGGPESAPIPFRPGVIQPLVIEMPSLGAPPRVDRRAHGRLRVVYDGREVLSDNVHYFGRAPPEVSFGTNPIGGTIANEPLRGQLATLDGRPVVGRPVVLFHWTARLRNWVVTTPQSALYAVAAAVAGAFLAPVLIRLGARHVWCPRHNPVVAGNPHPPHVAFALTAMFCTGIFVTVITGFTFRLFAAESFGRFYDDQIASLLAGKLDVPAAALDGEAFVFQGKTYGYFGPTPALLRLPFALTGIGFGRLSRGYMVAYYLACLAAVYALLVNAARLLSQRATWPTRTEVILLVGSAGLGSTLFFVSSRAYIYHEAILCGAAFALWGAWGVLRWLAAPTEHRWWLLALGCGVLAVHARPPVGLLALAFLGFAAAANLGRAWLATARESNARCAPAQCGRGAPTPQADAGAISFPPATPGTSSGARGEGTPPTTQPNSEPRSEGTPPTSRQDSSAGRRLTQTSLRMPVLAGLLAVLGVLSFNGLSYLKFRSFEGIPLRYNVQYHAARLAVFQGRNFHLGNIPYVFDSYVRCPNFVLRPTFPYFFIQSRDPGEYPGSRIDMAENTLAFPYAMPSLVFLAVLGYALAVFRWPAARLPLATLAAGTAPMAVALFAAIAISQRYTADFVPFLITAAAFGLTALATLPARTRRVLIATAAVLAVAAVLVTLAITLHYQGEGVWGVPDDVKTHYLTLRQHMDLLLGFSRP